MTLRRAHAAWLCYPAKMQPAFAQQLCTPLQTPCLMLQPRVGGHADAAFDPLQDDTIYQWISANKPRDVESLRKRWMQLESRLSPDGTQAWLAWAITTRSDGSLVGQVDAVVDERLACTNFGYYLFPKFWGRGLATEAVQVAADHLLAQGITQLTATVTVGNRTSDRVLQKTGFSFTRVIPNNDTLRGTLVDDAQYIRNR